MWAVSLLGSLQLWHSFLRFGVQRERHRLQPLKSEM
jgi:hypothetical protein